MLVIFQPYCCYFLMEGVVKIGGEEGVGVRLKSFYLKYATNMDYDNYLKSRHWKKKRADKHKRNRSVGKDHCAICGTGGNLEVHHLSYKVLGDEPFCLLRLLCRRCHQVISSLPKLPGNGRIIKKWLIQRRCAIEILKERGKL